MHKLFSVLGSMKLTVLALAFFAFASALATFIENDFGTPTAKSLVYYSLWFEVLLLVLGINLVLNIFKYKLYKPSKLHIGIFHIAFVVILFGAGVTRYIGYEGTMHIREGDSTNLMLSSESYVQLEVESEKGMKHIKEEVLISKLGSNDFSFGGDIDGKHVDVRFNRYMEHAVKKIEDDVNGKVHISIFVTSQTQGMTPVVLHDDVVFKQGGYTFSLSQDTDIRFFVKDDSVKIISKKPLNTYRMADKSTNNIKANTQIDAEEKLLYTIDGITFAVKQMNTHSVMKYVEASAKDKALGQMGRKSAVVVDVSYEGETKEAVLVGIGAGLVGTPVDLNVGGKVMKLRWGSENIALPFSLRLDKFVLDRYAGSMSPSSYESYVTLFDKKAHIEMPYHIYMNHVLDYMGFRFFQSSYDRDEKGTVLSVNNDPGTLPTYIGYFLLGLGFLYNVFSPKSRFRKLAAQISVAFMVFMAVLVPQNTYASDITKEMLAVDKNVANSFSSLLVQTHDGRIKPMNTLATDLLNKIHRSTHLKEYDLNADQVLFGMMTNPSVWSGVEIIRVKHTALKRALGLSDSAKYASYDDFFTGNGFKLARQSDMANRKKPASRDTFDKAVLKVSERVNVVYSIFLGNYLSVFPKKDDPTNKWVSPKEALTTFEPALREEIKTLLVDFFESVDAKKWDNVLTRIEDMKKLQHTYGTDIIPSQTKIDTEIFMNHAGIFLKLVLVYLLGGLLLIGAIFTKILKENLNIDKFVNIIKWVVIIGFMIHTIGLGLRWYISGHAPWSNAYESMVYIAWSIVLAGIYFSKYSKIALALTGILGGISLFVAHLSFMDPQVTNLVPVLKSYWLNIHVSVITASYGFLGLSAILGFFSLILYSIKNPENEKRINKEIKEASNINEMTMIAGLFLLTIGNFLGGIWANESWGRYWGWDPKETWALISILVYSVVLHLRFIPGFNTRYTFAVASMLSYWAIIMTYFGVNFYLSGMHSYAAGDPLPVPSFIYYVFASMAFLIIMGYPKREKKDM